MPDQHPAKPAQTPPPDTTLGGLNQREVYYAQQHRAPNTLRGYAADWQEFTSWCQARGSQPAPADPAALTGYLTMLADSGAKLGTISRRLSSIRYVHRMRGMVDPTTLPRVMLVWDGIRRDKGHDASQSRPLLLPLLIDALDACPTTRVFKDPKRADEPDLAGARDRALLLVGFVAALRRSELSAMNVTDLDDHELGMVISLPRSKTNQHGPAELVVLPRSSNPARCPVTALTTWLDLAGITDGPVFRGVTKGNRARPGRLNPESINTLVQQAITRTGHNPDGYSAHSLRAGFVTHAHLRGATDRAIARQTRHRSLASVGTYVRVESAWNDNAATNLGL
ncbi:site-specific recombinase XerD [Branchiibius hedensis]|uniref:Site-specific recombinase XerD n=1 Tax=Branchiibius hedensis TaxID=672460 RepID=A0A2Y8ZRD4_9MICO|nr:tyrosine-type recombinase/integrase [Branchiibius hedensis]PWJ25632.1 site-specific recombinase XerD [Branchiibius hedensis]SSA34445.1 Site-specific recombinase XerD [Branchiibius hedensis]